MNNSLTQTIICNHHPKNFGEHKTHLDFGKTLGPSSAKKSTFSPPLLATNYFFWHFKEGIYVYKIINANEKGLALLKIIMPCQCTAFSSHLHTLWWILPYKMWSASFKKLSPLLHFNMLSFLFYLLSTSNQFLGFDISELANLTFNHLSACSTVF